VSIPRDTEIVIPDCVGADLELIPEAGWGGWFNAVFSYGEAAGGIDTGAACTILAVEEMSDVRIDAYVVVDFSGFVQVVDAIGGVTVTVQCPIYSPGANGLELQPGVVTLDGMTAINVARARVGDGLGDNSDLSRINRQHLLFSAIATKVFDLNYITDLPKLYGLARAVLGSLTTNLGDLSEIAGLAYSLRGFSPGDIVFTTVPVGEAPDDPNRVVVLDWAAEPLWEALRTDQPLPQEETEPVDPDQTATPSAAESTPPTGPESTDTAPTTGQPAEAPPPPIQTESDCW
jgi:LCP family protein required for cell wall assembly